MKNVFKVMFAVCATLVASVGCFAMDKPCFQIDGVPDGKLYCVSDYNRDKDSGTFSPVRQAELQKFADCCVKAYHLYGCQIEDVEAFQKVALDAYKGEFADRVISAYAFKHVEESGFQRMLGWMFGKGILYPRFGHDKTRGDLITVDLTVKINDGDLVAWYRDVSKIPEECNKKVIPFEGQ